MFCNTVISYTGHIFCIFISNCMSNNEAYFMVLHIYISTSSQTLKLGVAKLDVAKLPSNQNFLGTFLRSNGQLRISFLPLAELFSSSRGSVKAILHEFSVTTGGKESTLSIFMDSSINIPQLNCSPYRFSEDHPSLAQYYYRRQTVGKLNYGYLNLY